MPGRRARALALTVITVALVATEANAQATHWHRPFPRPTLQWLAAQLVPSVGARIDDRGASLHVRWQLTPLAIAFGVRRGVFPLRSAVVESGLRVGGSLELFIAPEFTTRAGPAQSQWGIRTGLRTYAPLIQHGEYLSASFALSALTAFDGSVSLGYEAGLYVLFGLFGLQTTYSPHTRDGQALWIDLAIRYF